MKLVFINKIGKNWKGNYIYEFLFSDLDLEDIDGEGWDSYPSSGNPIAPEDFIKEALTMYCGDYDRVVIRSVSSGTGEKFSGILPAKTVEGNPENGIFYKLVVNISDSVVEDISEPCA